MSGGNLNRSARSGMPTVVTYRSNRSMTSSNTCPRPGSPFTPDGTSSPCATSASRNSRWASFTADPLILLVLRHEEERSVRVQNAIVVDHQRRPVRVAEVPPQRVFRVVLVSRDPADQQRL